MLQRLSPLPKASYRSCNFILNRAAYLSTSVSQSQEVKTRGRPKKSKITLEELPTEYVLPNGQRAVPLGHWNDASNSHDLPLSTTTARSNAKPKSRTPRKRALSPVSSAGEPTLEQEPPARSQLAREILANLERFPHCLLLTRVGSFYESYFNQAIEISGLLGIKLTSRKWDGARVPMCGFPLVHLDKYLKVLVQKRKRSVAMCEEFLRPSSFGEKEFERRITRIISPGTLIDETFLNSSENNFLLAINRTIPSTTCGLAWIDISTGEFYSKDCHLETLEDELVRICPKEVVLPPSFQNWGESSQLVLDILKENDIHFNLANNFKQVDASLSLSSLSAEAEAISLLTSYLHSTLLEYAPILGSPSHEVDLTQMHIDAHTIKALELRETDYESSARGSILSVIKRTVTTSGTRLLARRLCSPSASASEIQGWQSLVSFFFDRPHLRADLRETLKKAGDIGRIVQTLLLRKGNIDDLVTVKKTIILWSTIAQRLRMERELDPNFSHSLEAWRAMDLFIDRLHDLTSLSARIGEALSLEIQPGDCDEVETAVQAFESEGNPAPISSSDSGPGEAKWGINSSFSPKLFSLDETLKKYVQQKEELQASLQIHYNAPSLTLRSSSQQGMHVHLGRARRDQVKLNEDPAFVKLSESTSTSSYIYQPWSQLGGLIGTSTAALNAASREAFGELVNEVLQSAEVLRTNASIQDELDIALGFSVLATELNFTKPTITKDGTYHVLNGRHPSVEMGLMASGRTFTPNTIEMTPTSSMHVITGPNMAGKSTALRQTALITVLAQIGSFVPADSATIGIVDKLFTRIGAKDDLFRDRSTFMVEMMETADILKGATPNSLVIMDEVGRGTTMKDGLAIAFATVHHLLTTNQSRCLFATHFHELSDMLGCSDQWRGTGTFSNVRFFCTDVDELDANRFVYSYRLNPGVNRESHGLKVAQIAGLPSPAVEIARKTLAWLRSDHGYAGDQSIEDIIHKR
ncbi:hypothetical protein FA15DRAFT_690314 [Coprinopsis marcescibilis]|uniref:DNA mismatch repair proteins mutS family domain-containing protein n=1 Tax=Coprinopsis marcescibilis TaxID=230819 RepID=A0A5C3LCQ6_COPMA|nr:hypothetical protein FA15DRAFT_690314 [Coprinopsis marcescibilis]